MDFALSDEHEAIRKAAAAYADAYLAPAAERVDRTRELDPKAVEEARRLGFYGVNVPQEYGGLGLDTIGLGLVASELGRGCGSMALSLLAHTVLAVEHVRAQGTEAQKRAILPKLAAGEWLGAWGLTEPGGGSDVLAMKTTAKPDDDGWILEGEKCFITNGSRGDLVVVTARTPQGYGAFAVRKGTPGFSAARSHDLACMRGSDTATLRFEACRVGPDGVLGDPGKALRQSFACLDLERIIAGAMMTAMAREVTRRSVAYAKERTAFGKPIAKFQAIYSKLANLDAAVEASEILWLKAAWRRDRGEPFTREAAIAKLTAARLAQHACLDAIQIHAGAGLEIKSGLDRFLRDSLLGTIGGGTSEIQEMVIARHLGLDIDAGA